MGVDLVDLRTLHRGSDPPLYDHLAMSFGRGPDVGLRGANTVTPAQSTAQGEVRDPRRVR